MHPPEAQAGSQVRPLSYLSVLLVLPVAYYSSRKRLPPVREHGKEHAKPLLPNIAPQAEGEKDVAL